MAVHKLSAAQRRVLDRAAMFAAIRLVFDVLRKHYPEAALAEVVAIHNGRSLKANERDARGPYDVYAAGGLVGRHAAALSTAPFVVIGRKGSAGKQTYAPRGGWVIDTAYFAQPKSPADLDVKFLYYALASLDFSDDVIVTAIPGINRTAIYRRSIPMPPLELQSECAAFLDDVEGVKDGISPRDLPAPLDPVPNLIRKIDLVARKVARAREARDRASMATRAMWPAIIDAEMSRWHREGYPVTTVADVEELVTSGPRNLASQYAQSGFRFYRAQDLTSDGDISDEHVAWVDVPAEAHTRALTAVGDVLVVITGATIGRAAVIEEHHPPGLVSQHVGLVRVNSSRVNPRFLHYAMLAPGWAGGQLASARYGQGKPGLNLTNLRHLMFPLPSLAQQDRAVAALDCMRSRVRCLSNQQARAAAELDALVPAAMKAVSEGHL